MKNVILLAFMLCIGYTGLAQIKKPSKIKTTQLKNLKLSEAQLKNMNAKEIANLPITKVDRGKLVMLKPNESWNLDAPKLSDKDLHVKSLFGFYRSDGSYEIHPIFVHDNRNGFSNLEYMKLQFRPETNQRYRLQIQLEPGDYPNHHVMFNTGGYNRAFVVNDQYDEILLDFRADSNGFAISNLVKRNEPNMLKIHQPLKIRSIKLDKVE
ncbi:hypothetical protein NE848_05905 [Gramella jeungdoensis]|uniref:DUF4251 domain-containing protein n=1 Tax=Gramella jeungdoensis TaxID=708091 RepID=A0ABT0Z156_9FLAO|nr:hypothetical protein [Gramella jeungdoensis]MCM8568902.1 hypothetical protein [Gramella jeungdoensis]